MALFEFSPAELVRATWRGATGIIDRARPDHQTIRARAMSVARQHMTRLYLYQAVAPSRQAVRAHDDSQVGRAMAFAGLAIGTAAESPEGATAAWTRFRVEHADGTTEFSMYVHRNGLVELLSELPTPDDQEAEVWLDGTELARRIMSLSAAVSGNAYAEVTTIARPWRRLARVDWHFDIATRVSGPHGPRSWAGIRFAGDQPPRTQQDWMDPPLYGYGGGRFSNRPRSGTGAAIATLFLERLASDSGYYECGPAVARTVAEAREAGAGDLVSSVPASTARLHEK